MIANIVGRKAEKVKQREESGLLQTIAIARGVSVVAVVVVVAVMANQVHKSALLHTVQQLLSLIGLTD